MGGLADVVISEAVQFCLGSLAHGDLRRLAGGLAPGGAQRTVKDPLWRPVPRLRPEGVARGLSNGALFAIAEPLRRGGRRSGRVHACTDRSLLAQRLVRSRRRYRVGSGRTLRGAGLGVCWVKQCDQRSGPGVVASREGNTQCVSDRMFEVWRHSRSGFVADCLGKRDSAAEGGDVSRRIIVKQRGSWWFRLVITALHLRTIRLK